MVVRKSPSKEADELLETMTKHPALSSEDEDPSATAREVNRRRRRTRRRKGERMSIDGEVLFSHEPTFSHMPRPILPHIPHRHFF